MKLCRRLVKNDKTPDKDVKCTTTSTGYTSEINVAKIQVKEIRKKMSVSTHLWQMSWFQTNGS